MITVFSIKLKKEIKKMKNKEILAVLRKEKNYIKENFGVLSIGLFGSRAKGIESPESDIDLLVELSEPQFDFMAGLQIHLEEKLGKPVDLVRKRRGMKSVFLKRIEKNIHYV